MPAAGRLILTRPRPRRTRGKRHDEVVHHQYRADRARRTLRGIDEQVGKAERASIEAHLPIVFAALAVGRLVEDRTGWSIRRFVQIARRYRTVRIRAGTQLLTAQDPIPADLRDALARINGPRRRCAPNLSQVR